VNAAKPLRLLAQSADDLTVISAAVQDGLAAMADVQWHKGRRRFSLKLQRYRHEVTAGSAKHGERVWAVLAFEGVTTVRSRNVVQGRPAALASILAIGFDPAADTENDPGGTITLTLAGDGAIVLDVECVDAVLADLGEARPAVARPEHG
jgi:Protein of unknown function (DUF2948)